MAETISGPVSLHAFDVPCDGGSGTNRVFILGDEHRSYQNMCRPCSASEGCRTILGFVDDAVRRARDGGTQLDVFVELPYVVRDGPLRTSWLRHIDSYMNQDSGRRLLESTDRASRKARYIGMLSVLYHAYRGNLYDDDAKSAEPNIRFHYADARLEPNVGELLPFDPADAPDRLHTQYGVRTTAQLKQLLDAFLFSRNFPRDVERAAGPLAARRIVTSALSSAPPRAPTSRPSASAAKNVHKIAKQFLRLPEGPVREAVRAYVADRADDAMAAARDDLGFDEGAHVLEAGRRARADAQAAVGAPGASPLWQQTVRLAHERFYRSFYRPVMQLAVHLVLMDAYLVARLARFCTRSEGAGGESIVYVGNAHAEYYVAFFTDYLGLAPVICQPIGAVPSKRLKRPSRMSSGDSNLNRCLPIVRHDRRSTCPSLGSRPLSLAPEGPSTSSSKNPR